MEGYCREEYYREEYYREEYCRDEYCREKYYREECCREEYYMEEYYREEYCREKYYREEYYREEYCREAADWPPPPTPAPSLWLPRLHWTRQTTHPKSNRNSALLPLYTHRQSALPTMCLPLQSIPIPCNALYHSIWMCWTHVLVWWWGRVAAIEGEEQIEHGC